MSVARGFIGVGVGLLVGGSVTGTSVGLGIGFGVGLIVGGSVCGAMVFEVTVTGLTVGLRDAGTVGLGVGL